MKATNKIITLIIIMVLSVSALFAADSMLPQDDVTYNLVTNRFSKTSARILSMGGAGIAVRSNQDALYVNPASLGEKGLVWNVPNVAVTIYNTRDMIATGIADNYKNISDEMGKYTEALIGILGKPGNNKIATVDAGVGVKLGRFALALDTQANFNTYTPPTSVLDIAVVPQVDVVASTGLGLRFLRDSSVNFDVGFAARFNLRAYYEKVDINTVMDAMNNSGNFIKSLQESKPVMVGYSIPIDFGANLNVPGGVTFSAVLRNVNGNFKFSQYESLKAAQNNAKDVLKSKLKVESPMSLDFGFGWKPKFGLSWLADPNIAIDFVDTVGFFKNMSFSNMFTHLRAGIELQLLSVFELRAGLNQGYVSLGLGVNLMNIIHLEASYYRLEFGKNVGDKPIDAITIRTNIFWER